MMRCPDCRNIGRAPCIDCQGKGYTVCPACRGDWSEKCSRCSGKGNVGYRTVRVGIFYKKVPIKCSRCGGDGKIECPKCRRSTYRGKVPCETCKGAGRAGACVTCQGTKTVPCRYCEAGGEIRDKRAVLLTGSSQPAGGGLGALSSPDALADAMRKRPAHPREDIAAWNALTTLQKKPVADEYARKLRAWEADNNYRTRKVAWMLKVVDIVPGARARGFILTARGKKEDCIVTAPVPATARDRLLQLKKSDSILLMGTIKDYVFKRSGIVRYGAPPAPTFEVTLEQAQFRFGRELRE